MSNSKKRFDFENSFSDALRSSKRPKLEVIQRPSGGSSRNESFENSDDNDDLWGDELETDAVEEVLLLESQASSLKPQVPEKTFSVPSAVFQPKTAVLSTVNTCLVSKQTCSLKTGISSSALKGSSGPFATPSSTHNTVRPLTIETVKTNVIGKGCQRSSSFPATSTPQTCSISKTSWLEDKGKKDTFPSNVKSDEGVATKSSTDESYKKLKNEIERLKAETLTKSGEAALLRQKVKDAGLELEKERQNRAEILEKINQKHQEEIAALRRELEAAKTQLQFKEHDVDDALEKCKLLKSGAIRVRPLDVKLSSPSRPSTSSKQQDFPCRSAFERSTPRKKAAFDKGKETEFMRKVEFSNEVNYDKVAGVLRVKVNEAGIQTETLNPRKDYSKSLRYREGCLLSSIILPHWFEMESNATEEQFEERWEGVSIATDLLKRDIFEGESLEKMVHWCWQRLIKLISSLKQKKEEEVQFEKKIEESRVEYEEWCLDRRIPLTPQNSSEDSDFQKELLHLFSEDFMANQLESLLSHRLWCLDESIPEIRRTFALAIALMRSSKNMAYAFGSHYVKVRKESSACFVCGCSIKNKNSNKCLRSVEDSKIAVKSSSSLIHQHACESFENVLSQNMIVTKKIDELPTTSKYNKKSIEGVTKETSKELNLSLKTISIQMNIGDQSKVDSKANDNLQNKSSEDSHKNYVHASENKEIDPTVENMRTYDFLHLIEFMCNVISQMKYTIPMEGTLASFMIFLTTLNQQIVLSKNGLLRVSEIIKKILFLQPHLRLLLILMQLLVATAQYPLILQRMCVNAGPEAAYRDRLKNIWYYTRDACPLQVLITILENVTDERIPNAVSKESWLMYRAKLGYCFIRWLTIALGQKGHSVNWLCYAMVEDIHEELREKRETDPDEQSNLKEMEVTNENAQKTSNLISGAESSLDEGDSAEQIPIKSLFSLKISESDEEETDWDEKEPICCCRRWTVNIIINFLYTILTDFESVLVPSSKIEIMKDADELKFIQTDVKVTNDLLIFEQSRILKLGIFVLRELLRRGYPEFNTPRGEGFQWNHYTIKGSVLVNGKVVTKQYDHKNCDGGPIGGRYLLFLTKLQNNLKHRIKNFCHQTEMALQELLEVENCIENNDDGDFISEDVELEFWNRTDKI